MVETPSPGPVLPMTLTRPPHPTPALRRGKWLTAVPTEHRQRTCFPSNAVLPRHMLAAFLRQCLSAESQNTNNDSSGSFSLLPRTANDRCTTLVAQERDERVACTGVPRRQGPSPGALAQEGCVILPALTTPDSPDTARPSNADRARERMARHPRKGTEASGPAEHPALRLPQQGTW